MCAEPIETRQLLTPQGLQDCIVQHITRLHTSVRVAHPRLIAITGMDCAGKSTLAIQVRESLVQQGHKVVLVSIDEFLVPLEVKPRREPEWLGYFEDAFHYKAFRLVLEKAAEAFGPASRSSVVLAEGVFLLRHELRDLWHFAVWLEIEASLVLERARVRDLAYFGDEATVRRTYERRCGPAQRHHERRDRPRIHADLIATFDKGQWAVRERINPD